MAKHLSLYLLSFSIMIIAWLPIVMLGIDYETLPATIPREEMVIFHMHYQMMAPDLMNPFVPRNSYRWHHCVGASACLIAVNFENGTIDGYVAERWEFSPDYKTLTFYLRRNVKWSDGHPFTSQDVAFTLNMRITNDVVLQATWARLIERVETPDEYTVVIRLKQPYPRIIYTFDESPIVPKHIWEEEDPATFKWSRPESVGPYILVRSTETEQIFKRIEGKWWGEDIFGPALPKYVMFRYVPPELLVAEMAKDGLDIAMVPTISDVKLLRNINPYWRCWEKLGSTEIIVGKFHTVTKMQLNLAKYPWNITEVRRAISLAIDRVAIHNMVGEGMESIAEPNPIGVVPLYQYHLKNYVRYVEEAGLIDKYKPLKYDPEEAQRILESLGFRKGSDGIYVTPNGVRLSMEIMGREVGPTLEREMVADMSRAIGIDATTRLYATEIYNQKRQTGDYDAVLENLGAWTDPFFTFEQWHSSYYKPIGEKAVSNYMRYINTELDAIIDELQTLPYDLSTPRAKELYLKAQEIYYKDVLEIPIIEVSQYGMNNERYWTGWPDAENRYASFDVNDFLCCFKVFKLKPRAVPIYTYVTVYAIDQIPAFTGVDGKTYGPYDKGAAMYIPKEDAERLISEGLASYSPLTPGLEVLTSLVTTISQKVDTLASTIDNVNASITALLLRIEMYALVSSAISVISMILIIAIVLILKKPK